MAQTDARPGFRLPWNSERSNTEETDIDETATADETAQADVDGGAGWPTTSDQAVVETSEVAEATAGTDAAEAPEAASPDATDAGPAAASPNPRRPSKFMEDLTKAMQAAAEEARTRTLGQFQTDAKGHIEEIHAKSATQAADLRKTADDDVAGIRDWSKAEIARVREETERKITARKGQLEIEIEGQAAQIEREVQVVQDRVSEFEAEMAAFFERLLAEDDPTSIASMAERLPEPPPFDTVSESAAAILAQAPAEDVVLDQAVTEEAPEEAPAEEAAVEETTAEASAETVAETPSVETEAAAQDGDASPVAEAVEGEAVPADLEMDREAAFAAVQAAAEAAASAEVATDAANRAETVAEIAMGIGGDGSGMPDFDAAEVEAAAAVDSEGGEIPVIGDDDLAARIAGLVPASGKGSAKVHSGEATSTQVVVVGLVSVASIASFKRHLGRISGVQSVGVSSGPDGEFMFAVHHAADINLRDAIPSLPSFQARVTSAAEGVLQVTAHDPESNR